MNIGALRHRLTLQREQVSEDDYGMPQTTWVDVGTYWAQISPKTAGERFEADQQLDESKVEITMRYRQITVKDRLVHGATDTTYDITDVRVPNVPDMLIIEATAGLTSG